MAGFEGLVLGDPSPHKKYHRLGWVTFRSEAAGCDLEAHERHLQGQRLGQFELHCTVFRSYYNKIKYASDLYTDTERMRVDAALALRLAAWADLHWGVAPGASFAHAVAGTLHEGRALDPSTDDMLQVRSARARARGGRACVCARAPTPGVPILVPNVRA